MRPASLRAVLLADAAVCGVFGAFVMVLAAPLSGWVPEAGEQFAGLEGFLRWFGLGVMLVGAYVYWVAAQRPIRPQAVWPILAVEVAWILASAWVVTVYGAALSAFGLGLIVMSALAVGAFLWLEVLGLRGLEHYSSSRS